MDTQLEQDLRILEEIERDPDITQADLAARMNVAVGSVNWYIKRLINKGYVKVRQMQRRKLKYFITPQGLAVKAHLTTQYMRASLRTYRELRQEARETLERVQAAGHQSLHLEEDGEAAEIFRLTCLEQGVRVVAAPADGVPTVQAQGARYMLRWAESEKNQERPES
jgi:DNA-binding MarR family transcriptional regulator